MAKKPLNHIELLKKKLDREIKARRMSEQLLEDKSRSLYQLNKSLENSLVVQKQQQVRITHSEKMASLGVMSAGIAHEINTPLQYIGDNLEFLNKCFLDFVDSVKHIKSELVKTKFFDLVDFEFLNLEIPSALRESIEGYQRILSIIKAMKAFSRPGDKKKKNICINELINNTIILTKNQFKHCSDVKLNLQQDLVKINIYEGEIKQVLINMIVNAAQSIQYKNNKLGKELGLIEIATKNTNGGIKLLIKDNGEGIPENIIHQIFDPFFTTKPVGVGTGQGLSISYAIVTEKHGGSIQVHSNPGKGTLFIIHLPKGDDHEKDEDIIS